MFFSLMITWRRIPLKFLSLNQACNPLRNLTLSKIILWFFALLWMINLIYLTFSLMKEVEPIICLNVLFWYILCFRLINLKFHESKVIFCCAVFITIQGMQFKLRHFPIIFLSFWKVFIKNINLFIIFEAILFRSLENLHFSLLPYICLQNNDYYDISGLLKALFLTWISTFIYLLHTYLKPKKEEFKHQMKYFGHWKKINHMYFFLKKKQFFPF